MDSNLQYASAVNGKRAGAYVVARIAQVLQIGKVDPCFISLTE